MICCNNITETSSMVSILLERVDFCGYLCCLCTEKSHMNTDHIFRLRIKRTRVNFATIGNRKALIIPTCAISAEITKHEKGYQSRHNPCHCSHHERTTEYSQENTNRLEKCCSIKSMGIFTCWLVGNYRSRKREHNDKLEVASENTFSVTLSELEGDNPILKAYCVILAYVCIRGLGKCLQWLSIQLKAIHLNLK